MKYSLNSFGAERKMSKLMISKDGSPSLCNMSWRFKRWATFDSLSWWIQEVGQGPPLYVHTMSWFFKRWASCDSLSWWIVSWFGRKLYRNLIDFSITISNPNFSEAYGSFMYTVCCNHAWFALSTSNKVQVVAFLDKPGLCAFNSVTKNSDEIGLASFTNNDVYLSYFDLTFIF